MLFKYLYFAVARNEQFPSHYVCSGVAEDYILQKVSISGKNEKIASAFFRRANAIFSNLEPECFCTLFKMLYGKHQWYYLQTVLSVITVPM